MGVRCLCGLLFLIKTCEAHLVQEIGKGSTANVQCTFTNNLCFFSCSSSSISTCVDKEPVQCAGCHHITSSLIHKPLSRAKVIGKQHISKRGFPRSDRTKKIDRIYIYLTFTFQGFGVGQHSPLLNCLFWCMHCHLLKNLILNIQYFLLMSLTY